MASTQADNAPRVLYCAHRSHLDSCYVIPCFFYDGYLIFIYEGQSQSQSQKAVHTLDTTLKVDEIS
jgi:hypothetical protein